MNFLLSVIFFLFGVWLVGEILLSAIRTFVLPRAARDPITLAVFTVILTVFNFSMKRMGTYKERDRVMAVYAPVSLLALLVIWLTCIIFGYMCMFRALDIPGGWESAFKASGSALFTLGFAPIDGLPMTIISFTESGIGLLLIALLIAYLPTIYSAFSRRETAVTLLEVRAGSPPSAIEMYARVARLERMAIMHDLFLEWETWFADIDESHTSLASLPFFRSPQPERSWITAAGVVLDAAALMASTFDIPRDPQCDLTIRSGYIALRHIADNFGISYNLDPDPDDPISITPEEYYQAYEELQLLGIPVKADRERAWQDFKGWRVNYDYVLIELCDLTMAPMATWSSDRRSRYPIEKSIEKEPKSV
jgi:hypothetical protein